MFDWIAELTGGDAKLRVAFALALMAGVVTIGLTLQVFAMRVSDARRRRRWDAARLRWRPLLLAHAAGDAPPLPALTLAERMPFLVLWNQLQDGLRGGAHEALNRLAHTMGLHDLAVHYAVRRRGGPRLLGLRTLGHLGQASDWPRLVALLDEPRSFISLAAARALLQIDPPRAVPLVIDEFLGRSDWPVPRLGAMLRDAGPDACGPALAERVLFGEAAQQLRLLPLARLTEVPGRGSMVEALLQVASDPFVLAATLQQTHSPGSLPRVRALTTHDDWQVRAYAALALGRLGNADDRRYLLALLTDREWWVRYRAAQALTRLPGFDPAAGDALLASLGDRYARDMVAQVLAERRYEGATP